MLFPSPIFLFAFLPTVLLSYYLVFRLLGIKASNVLLLIASIFFYAWGEGNFVLLMLATILANYFLGLMLITLTKPTLKRVVLALAVTVNVGLLVSFKYANYLIDNLNVPLSWLGIDPIVIQSIPLPLGISFFIFQAMSYVIDGYRGEGRLLKNPVNIFLYISFFPQLIAGPIVRYRDIDQQITFRDLKIERINAGIQRFVIGLAKKVLIANAVAEVADSIFALPPSELHFQLAWMGITCYAIQIYFDFSAYSDMAIGLGRMFGFEFLENFNYPYISKSIQEFWRRWHISLSTWFRDYLYIPLGGNRGSRLRTYFNLVLVFLLCGLWHGAAWTFVIWGGFHGVFLMIERMGWAQILARLPGIFSHIYVLVVVLVGWVLFRAENMHQVWAFLASMAGIQSGRADLHSLASHLNHFQWWMLGCGLIGSAPWWQAVEYRVKSLWRLMNHVTFKIVIGSALLLWCVMRLASDTYNPFIYFRF